jgi:hypothetical protein
MVRVVFVFFSSFVQPESCHVTATTTITIYFTHECEGWGFFVTPGEPPRDDDEPLENLFYLYIAYVYDIRVMLIHFVILNAVIPKCERCSKININLNRSLGMHPGIHN